MEKNNQKNGLRSRKLLRISLWIGSFLLICFLALVAGGWYLQTKFPEKLKALVYEKSHGEYQLEFDKLTLSLLKGNLFLENVKLKVDTQAYVTNLTEDSGNYLIQAHIQQLRFSGLNILRYLKTKQISMNAIHIEQPDLVLYQMRDTLKKDSVEKAAIDQVPNFLKGAELDLVTVNELSFTKRSIGHLQDSVNHLTGVSFSIQDVYLDPSAASDSSRVWFSKDIKVSGKDMHYRLGDGMYVLKVANFSLSTKNRTVEMDTFKMVPMYKDFDFFKKLGKAGSRYEVTVPEVRVANFDFKKLETEGKYFAQSLLIENAYMDIFVDKGMPSSKQNAIRNAPNLALQRLKTPLFIDSMNVKNVELHYREYNPKSNQTGDVFFTDMGGTMTNITNDSVALEKNHWATSHFGMRFLGQAKIQVNLNLNLISKEGEFTYKGSLGAANARVYNKILEPLAMVRVDKGYFNKISFDIKANERGSRGTVQILYTGLEVSVLVKENSKKIGRVGLFSFLANSFLITSDNPEEGMPARVSHVTYKHSPDHSFFNLMWKSIFEGIKGNVIETKEQRHEKRVMRREMKRAEREEAKQRKKQAKE